MKGKATGTQGRISQKQLRQVAAQDHANIAEELRVVAQRREADRAHDYGSFKRPTIEVAERISGFHYRWFVDSQIRSLPRGQKFSVMELGCGDGELLGVLKKLHPKSVVTIGHNLAGVRGVNYRGKVDRMFLGEVRAIKPPDELNLIFTSGKSAAYYTKLKATLVQNVSRWLAPGGVAVLDVGPLGEKNIQTLKRVAHDNGIGGNFVYENGTIYMVKPDAMGASLAKLKGFLRNPL